MNPLELITFDTTGFELQGDSNGVRVWHSLAGDGIGLYHHSIAPNIEADLADQEAVRGFYRRIAVDAGLAIIEVETLMLEDCRAIRTIIKVPQQPTGMTYLGTITLPFRDFSYVLKVQCAEHGVTGLRDAVVLDQLMGRGEVSVLSQGGLQGWMQDPYDTSMKAPLMKNRAEASEYDTMFPDHPLSRARLVLNHVEKTLTIAPEVQGAPAFEFQAREQKPKPWWKRW